MIYLDHSATTPVAEEVLEAMLPYFREEWGNPSSPYRFGAKLKGAIEEARERVANLLTGAQPHEILFTSGGTESNNTALLAALRGQPGKRHIVTSMVEHSSVLSACRALERDGYRVTYLPVDTSGLLSIPDLDDALCSDTALVSLAWANNETGVLAPVEEAAALCRARDIPFHCDAVQVAGKAAIDLRRTPVDYLSLSGHKFHAPKGIGALYVHRRARFAPFLQGGHQERNRRGGTENVPSIIGLGKAAELAHRHLATYDCKVRPLRDQLENEVLGAAAGAARNGHPTRRLAHITNLHFPGVEAEALLLLLDQAGICASSGSACLADSPDPSHVIAAMKPGDAAHQSVRFSLGLRTSREEIEKTVAIVQESAVCLQSTTAAELAQ